MFNGMMDPEFMRIAQEQISRMSPDELAKIQQQMMSNPDLMKMASESMKNFRPEDYRQAAEQLKHVRPEEMAEISQKVANASPEEIDRIRARADAQISYQLSAAKMLKDQGNEFHNKGRFRDASEKYMLAKKNLTGLPMSNSRTLLLACSLNLMSCYLKTEQHEECIKEGAEVLAYDSKNVKALYRRGQAQKELGNLEDSVSDLRKAHDISPDDETIAEVLRDARERLATEASRQAPGRLVIEELTEEECESTSKTNCEAVSAGFPVRHQQESDSSIKGPSSTKVHEIKPNSEYLRALKDNPETIRSFQNFLSSADPDTIAAISGGKAAEVPPDMFKAASKMIRKMSPEELQNMLEMASSFQGENSMTDSFRNGFGPGSVAPDLSPDMLKTASDMFSKMPSEELQKMFEMTSSLRMQEMSSASSSGGSSRAGVVTDSSIPEARIPASFASEGSGETSSSGPFSGLRTDLQSNFPTSASDLQEQMRNQMKDPAMRQMFTSMMKNMNPEMMAKMSEQFGMKLSPEDAAKAQEAMASLSPDVLDKMMRWADRIQRGAEGARKTKNWLLGKPGMILAILMLLLAITLHRLGFIGS